MNLILLRNIIFLLLITSTPIIGTVRILPPHDYITPKNVHDHLMHECGLALVCLRKPLSFYQEQYQDIAWGLKKTCLLMEKQRNRGQDGAGIAVFKKDMPAGQDYITRFRTINSNPIEHIFAHVINNSDFSEVANINQLKQSSEFLGEIYLGHVRYGTYAHNTIHCCQPYIMKSNIPATSITLAGNFNMANNKELFNEVTSYGFHLTSATDTQIILTMLSYYLAQENTFSSPISIDIGSLLKRAAIHWDGGYVFAGFLGNGQTFILRDPAGIRPCFLFINDEVVTAASERSALAHVFNLELEQIHELQPGHAIIINTDNTIEDVEFIKPLKFRPCAFERIYFSRGNDPDIYRERKQLGRNLAQRVLTALNNDISHAVFTYIPNTSESAFLGLIEEINNSYLEQTSKKLWEKITLGTICYQDLLQFFSHQVHPEKIAHKDQLLRTFITQDSTRVNFVANVYDVTQNSVKPDDTLVVVDDSIVRGTTLQQSIIKQLCRLHPKCIIIVSSAPPILYPDCYGIDISQIGRFIAFQAAVELTQEKNNDQLIHSIAQACQQDIQNTSDINYVQQLYHQFSLEQLEQKIAQLIYPHDIDWHGDIKIIYQTIDGLHHAMPRYRGDWYFTGNYPTIGGYKVLNRSYLQWYHKNEERAY